MFLETTILMLYSTFHVCTVPPFDRESMVTAYGLYRLEKAGVQVWREISDKNRDFQAIIGQKEHNSNLAVMKWLNAERKGIKPSWENFFIVLRLVNLNHLAQKSETYLSGSSVCQPSAGSSGMEQYPDGNEGE